MNKQKSFFEILWDLWCIISIVGIWPRFIEPNLLQVNKLNLKIKDLPSDLEDLKIVQFSDLHLYDKVSDRFLDKVIRKINATNPDIILFTGDFICFSELGDKIRLKNFFSRLSAKFGLYAILGNHDYASFVSVNEKGEYDLLNSSLRSIKKILKRLFVNTKLASRTTKAAMAVGYHTELEEVLKSCHVHLLKNETVQLKINDSFLNITGLEEYVTGKCDPEKAFKGYDIKYPGIVLIHNPDGAVKLKRYPGDIILAGHTHGGQVNLPWLLHKFTLMEQPQFKKGLIHFDEKTMYVNKGIGSVIAFRWFAIPEILDLRLTRGK